MQSHLNCLLQLEECGRATRLPAPTSLMLKAGLFFLDRTCSGEHLLAPQVTFCNYKTWVIASPFFNFFSTLKANLPNQPVPQAFNVNNDRCGLSSATGINARVLAGRKPGSQVGRRDVWFFYSEILYESFVCLQLESDTSFGEFPWHAAVVNGETGDYLCAGTIISARFVLTVAHCVRKFQLTLLFVRVGDWDLSSTRNNFTLCY